MNVQTALNQDFKSDILSVFETESINNAFYEVVHNYRGGSGRLAPRLNKIGSTLSHEVNLKSDAHKLGLLDAVRILKITGAKEPLLTIAQTLGFTLVPVRQFEGCEDEEVLNSYALWMKEIGDVSNAVLLALEDGKVTPKEYSKILREGMDSIAAFHGFLRRIESLMVKL